MSFAAILKTGWDLCRRRSGFFITSPHFDMKMFRRGVTASSQLGAEAFGSTGPQVDAELIGMLALYFEQMGIRDAALRVTVSDVRSAAQRTTSCSRRI